MADTQLRFRQIHLDFHTGPAIPGVAAAFDADEFADTLAKAHVNSVTAFARCHHGYLYYDSQVHAARIHPSLTNHNLLLEQIEACHRRGIRVPIYTTIQWDQYTADRHRDWLCIDENGREYGTPPLQPGFYRNLDVFHPGYRQFLRDHVKEMLETLPVDGFFFDICQVCPSTAAHWIEAMDHAGLDPADATQRTAFARRVMDEWQLELTALIRGYNSDCTIFYNSGHVGPRHRPSAAAYSHYELESLPSGGWGYLHFPQSMRYARTLGKACLGMTGKFHTSWGDFSSYKNEPALQFECFNMLALGAQCSVGDQLPPSGQLDPYTYELIGAVYAEVEAKEPWCVGTQPVSEIAVFTPEAFLDRRSDFVAGGERDQPAAMGAVRMLQELRLQFDLVDDHSDLSGYRLIILPDIIPVDDALAARLQGFIDAGGAILASYASGIAPGSRRMNLPALGVEVTGEAEFSPDFLVPGGLVDDGLWPTGYVMYRRALAVSPQAGTTVLAGTEVPYHNRTWRTFCSHRHTPNSGQPGGPAIVANGRCIYFAHPVFSMYQDNAPSWCKQLVANAISLVMPAPVVEVDGPSTLLCALNDQPAESRQVLHLLHYVPERRCQEFDIIEDIIPLYNVAVRVRCEDAPKSVRLVPSGEALAFEHDGTRASFVVPELYGHAMIEIA